MIVAVAVFGFDLAGEPHFADESAYISQSYFADLFLAGDRNNPLWLEYAAFDLPPLPKYLIGLSLRAGGYRRPGPEAAYTWYHDIHYVCGTAAMRLAARWPSVLLGSFGCVAVYVLGVLAAGRRVGVLAALFLMANPLYRLLARRAMSDVPAEAFLLATAALGLWCWRKALAEGWRWTGALAAVASGVLGGLAVECKLNGGLGLMFLAAWAVLAVALPRYAPRRKLAVVASAMIAGAVAFPVFWALNPFLDARPQGALPVSLKRLAAQNVAQRTGHLLEHRMEVSRNQKLSFTDYALSTPTDKLSAVAVQGFGRFGLFGPAHADSTRRFDWSQDAGAVLWGPWVALGALWAGWKGRKQLAAGVPPTAWAILVQAAVALVTVTAYLPLAWDRYFLSLQAGSALLAAGVLVAAIDALTCRLRTPRGTAAL
jgi:4-amino-4-deoxy-L-arabinose transferase-like glycosyltransferase